MRKLLYSNGDPLCILKVEVTWVSGNNIVPPPKITFQDLRVNPPSPIEFFYVGDER